MSKLSKKIINLLYKSKLLEAPHSLWPHRLTVLAYHRIADPNKPGFDTFKPNVSATPTDFAAQMDFVRKRFNVISQDDLVAWLQNQRPLPPYPALITFDDGYRDNFDHAFPVLQNRNMPAIIFLATDYINKDTPFYCDLISYCFYHTRQSNADLPLTGRQAWEDAPTRTSIMNHWLDHLKTLPDDAKWAAIRQLSHALGVTVPDDAFAGLHLTWDQVRTMAAAGIDMGAHTQSHPILTRVPLAQAQQEIVGSKARIETEIDRPVTTFAYPNGRPPDFNAALQNILAQSGFGAAFTLVPGPTRPSEARQAPMAIRRIFIHHKDTLPRFTAKLMGLPRLLGQYG